MKNIYWIYINKFDVNISKIPRIEIAEALYDSNLCVKILTGYKYKKVNYDNYRFTIKYFATPKLKGFFKIVLLAKIGFWLFRNLKKQDIIISSPGDLWLTVLLKKLKYCKIHLDIRTLPVEVNTLRKKFEYLLLWYLPLRALYKKPDGYSFITELLKKDVEQQLNTVFDNYVLWHSGVNTKTFNVKKIISNRKHSKYVLSYIGSISKNRGLDLVIRAIYKLMEQYKDELLFSIVGDGPFLKNLKKIANDLKLSKMVSFKGFIPYEKIPNYLYHSDCLICPLPDRKEWKVSSPIKIFEYLAAAKPIILTPIEAHKQITNNNKYVVWTRGYSVEDLKNAIIYAIENRLRLSLEAKKAPTEILKEYEWKYQGKKLGKYLNMIN